MSLESKCEALEMAEEEIKKLKEEMEKRRILIEELSLKETQLKANLVASNENAKLLMQKVALYSSFFTLILTFYYCF